MINPSESFPRDEQQTKSLRDWRHTLQRAILGKGGADTLARLRAEEDAKTSFSPNGTRIVAGGTDWADGVRVPGHEHDPKGMPQLLVDVFTDPSWAGTGEGVGEDLKNQPLPGSLE